ncbi:MAG: sigma-70 family RNA polymerase sigma factor [Isosphaeraceae bacterium]
MERAARGEESARHALLDFHRDDLRRMVQARMDPRMGVRVDASDVVQDVLIDAWRRLDAYLRDRPLPFLPWLRQIVGERIIDMHRRHISSQCRGVKREERLELNEESAEALAGRLLTNDTSPSDRFLRSETQGRLKEALLSLPTKDREILIMRHLEHIGTAEIASKMEITEGAVKARLVRALIRLRGQMKLEP